MQSLSCLAMSLAMTIDAVALDASACASILAVGFGRRVPCPAPSRDGAAT